MISAAGGATVSNTDEKMDFAKVKDKIKSNEKKKRQIEIKVSQIPRPSVLSQLIVTEK